jgi:predicted amidohydrolase
MRALLAAIRCPKGDVDGNLAAHRELLTGAAAAGCELVLFPEMSLTGSADPAAHPDRLIGLDHPAVAALARATGETGVAACFGVAERSAGGDPHITQVFAASGGVVGVQRKRHLGEGEEAFIAATGPAIFAHAGTRFGVAICAEAGFDGPPPASPSLFIGRRVRCQPGAVPRGARTVRPAP